MPVYEYRCTRCHHLFEEFHRVGESPGPCPICGGPAQRVFTSVGLIFKGSGFHTTDYRKGKTPSGDGAAKEASTDHAPTTDAGAPASGAKPSSTTSASHTD